MQTTFRRSITRVLGRFVIVCGCAAFLPGIFAHAQETVPPPPAPTPVRPALPPGAVRISSAVIQGLLIKKAPLEYPEEARAMGLQGAVVLHVLIAKDGHPQEVAVVSGPSILQKPALASVKQWRWHPYLLNGEPVVVDTTIIVNFNLNLD